MRRDVTAWLMDSDPAIRWQVMRDLLDLPEAMWRPERTRVEAEGWGARLLACQGPDGQWAGGAFLPAGFTEAEWKTEGQPWTATCFTLAELRGFGLDPASESARRIVALVGKNCRWDEGDQPYWEGEVEECINARTVADGVYFGVDVAPIVARLLGEVQPDGGWNCERCNGSTCSSFDTTINVLEGLLAFEKATGSTPAIRAARRSGEDYLLARRLFRGRRSGEPADPDFLRLLHPNRWRHDILRGLDYFRDAGLHAATPPDPRLAEPVAILRGRRGADGRWPLDWHLRGRAWLEPDAEPGQPSRWITLRALRVLRWWDAATTAGATPADRP